MSQRSQGLLTSSFCIQSLHPFVKDANQWLWGWEGIHHWCRRGKEGARVPEFPSKDLHQTSPSLMPTFQANTVSRRRCVKFLTKRWLWRPPHKIYMVRNGGVRVPPKVRAAVWWDKKNAVWTANILCQMLQQRRDLRNICSKPNQRKRQTVKTSLWGRRGREES